ncbi:hypothetical protein F3F96_01560 [Mariprofundus sp. NF]|uniref:rhomboid family intramembrane serine protease n=1 Tax=Mariprofundus sp. NF TaxID=2608716 RepID=UPI0015A2B94F|nr:rhomboid family intramembrane serine protease [Mariprofundus sp. NF]NWF37830.1 hypothetical protein [Mariprofundus sp. NF]
MAALAVALLCWLVWFLPEAYQAALVYDSNAAVAGEWWRLWSGHLTHYTLSQLIADSGLVALLGLVLHRVISPYLFAISIIVALPLISLLLLWLVPEMNSYRGASGLAAMLWFMVGLHLIVQAKSGSVPIWIGPLFILLLIAKVAGEALALFPALSELPAGVVVAWQVHLFGMVIGLMVYLLCVRKQSD